MINALAKLLQIYKCVGVEERKRLCPPRQVERDLRGRQWHGDLRPPGPLDGLHLARESRNARGINHRLDGVPRPAPLYDNRLVANTKSVRDADDSFEGVALTTSCRRAVVCFVRGKRREVLHRLYGIWRDALPVVRDTNPSNPPNPLTAYDNLGYHLRRLGGIQGVVS